MGAVIEVVAKDCIMNQLHPVFTIGRHYAAEEVDGWYELADNTGKYGKWLKERFVPVVKEPAAKQPLLPTDPKERKNIPLFAGCFKYFPLALIEVARISKQGNEQHNPGQPLHWDRSKSQDHDECILRHHLDSGTRDSDGARHSAKLAWRALAKLQVELEQELENKQ